LLLQKILWKVKNKPSASKVNCYNETVHLQNKLQN